MRHANWRMIEQSPVAMRMYRAYRKLPDGMRAPARWLASPTLRSGAAMVRLSSDGRVMSGPFQGVQLDLSLVSNRNLLGYLLGTQELELHSVVEQIVERRYPTIINVGAADGYYAVGFASRMPKTEFVAFEALPDMRDAVLKAARLNAVDKRVRIEGYCQQADLARELALVKGVALVLADIEGGEIDLLDPVKIPDLRETDMLIETHDAFVPNCTERLIERFAESHDVERIRARPRTLADFPRKAMPSFARHMPATAVELMNERRAGVQQWLFLKARLGQNSGL